MINEYVLGKIELKSLFHLNPKLHYSIIIL